MPLLLASAQVSPFAGELGDSYYYIDHFEVRIDRPVDAVWPVIVDLGSWLPGLVDANESRPVAIEGEVFRLYGSFHMEVVKTIPEQMLVMVNLPNTQEAEDTQGLMMLSAKETNGNTLVSLFMSRVFFWDGPEENALRERRESSEFSASRRVTFEEEVLQRLKELAEGQR